MTALFERKNVIFAGGGIMRRCRAMLAALAKTGGNWLREAAKMSVYHKLHGRSLQMRHVTGFECITAQDHAEARKI